MSTPSDREAGQLIRTTPLNKPISGILQKQNLSPRSQRVQSGRVPNPGRP